MATLLLSTAILAVPSTFAATKVPTSRIVIPDDAPTEEESENNESGGAITVDDLSESEQDSTKPEDQPLATTNPPPIIRDLSALPPAVRETHQRLIKASLTGDIEQLRSLIGPKDDQTSVAFDDTVSDPIAHLKELSGDDQGHEILAILAELLEMGFVHLDPGTDEEMYVWPYFFAWPLDQLTPPMRVELFRVLTAGDLEDSIAFGSYIFYRVGIRPNGRWAFFVAGD